MPQPKINWDEVFHYPSSQCCECDAKLDSCCGSEGPPDPGDFTLCSYCGSLNVFVEGGTLRKPTDDEMLQADADAEVQFARKAIMRAIEMIKKEVQP